MSSYYLSGVRLVYHVISVYNCITCVLVWRRLFPFCFLSAAISTVMNVVLCFQWQWFFMVFGYKMKSHFVNDLMFCTTHTVLRPCKAKEQNNGALVLSQFTLLEFPPDCDQQTLFCHTHAFCVSVHTVFVLWHQPWGATFRMNWRRHCQAAVKFWSKTWLFRHAYSLQSLQWICSRGAM